MDAAGFFLLSESSCCSATIIGRRSAREVEWVRSQARLVNLATHLLDIAAIGNCRRNFGSERFVARNFRNVFSDVSNSLRHEVCDRPRHSARRGGGAEARSENKNVNCGVNGGDLAASTCNENIWLTFYFNANHLLISIRYQA
jgi:hypothetical protein